MSLGKNFARFQFITRPGVQIAIVGCLYAFATGLSYAARTRLDLTRTVTILGLTGAVAALAISTAFGFVVFFLNQTNTRKHDLFYRFKSTLFDFDKFLRDFSADHEMIWAASKTSIELSKLQEDDFPLRGGRWDEFVTPICEIIDKHKDGIPSDPFVGHRIYCYLGHAETVIHDLNLMCIRQALASKYVGNVTKALGALGFLVIVLLLVYIAPNERLTPALYAAPVLFGAWVIVLLAEIAFWLNRDHRNTLSVFMDLDGEKHIFRK